MSEEMPIHTVLIHSGPTMSEAMRRYSSSSSRVAHSRSEMGTPRRSQWRPLGSSQVGSSAIVSRSYAVPRVDDYAGRVGVMLPSPRAVGVEGGLVVGGELHRDVHPDGAGIELRFSGHGR